MGIDTKRIQSFAVKTACWLNIAVAAVYIASAYAGYADPRSCGYLALLGLAFPIFLVALLCFAVLWTVVCRRNLWVTGAAVVLTIPQLLAFCPLNFGSELSDCRRDSALQSRLRVHAGNARHTRHKIPLQRPSVGRADGEISAYRRMSDNIARIPVETSGKDG